MRIGGGVARWTRGNCRSWSTTSRAIACRAAARGRVCSADATARRVPRRAVCRTITAATAALSAPAFPGPAPRPTRAHSTAAARRSPLAAPAVSASLNARSSDRSRYPPSRRLALFVLVLVLVRRNAPSLSQSRCTLGTRHSSWSRANPLILAISLTRSLKRICISLVLRSSSPLSERYTR